MKPRLKWTGLILAAALMILVAGCASSSQPFEYHNDRDEKPGPGLFSGDDGGFIIYGGPTETTGQPNEDPPGVDAQ
jgi:hypothetical protein